MATEVTPTTIAPVLREAADRVAALTYTRVIRTDVLHAVLMASPGYDVAQAALDTLAGHIPDAGWLSQWAAPRGRDEVVAELRAAANAVELAEADRLGSADQSFDWTRGLDSDVRSLVTTWLEVGQRAFLFVRPVPQQIIPSPETLQEFS